MEKVPHGALQIEEDLALERATRTLKRVARGGLVAFITAGLLGLFGGGVLSEQTLASGDGQLQLRLPRFARQAASSPLRVQVSSGPEPRGELRLWLTRQYLEGARLVSVTPAPLRQESAGDRLTLVFVRPGEGTPAHVELLLQFRTVGRHTGQVGLEGDEGLTFHHFIYP